MAADFYTAIDAALAAHLRQLPALADVRTIEANVRDKIFAESAALGVQAFRLDELPAVNISTQVSPAASRPRTADRLTYEIPVFAAIVTRGGSAADVREQARAIQREIEAALHTLRGANTVLGVNCNITGDLVSSPPILTQTEAAFVAIATVEGTVFKSVDKGA